MVSNQWCLKLFYNLLKSNLTDHYKGLVTMLRINPSVFSQRLADSIAEFRFAYKKWALRVQKMCASCTKNERRWTFLYYSARLSDILCV